MKYYGRGRPLFQLYSFFVKVTPFGLKGPCSIKAPAPIDEQPGPWRRKQNNALKSTKQSLYSKSEKERSEKTDMHINE